MTPARRHRWSSSFAAPRVCRVGWAPLLDLQRRRHGGTAARHPPGGWSGASGAATAPADKNGSSCAVWLVYAKALHDWRARKGKREGPHPQVEMCHTVLVVRNGKEMGKGVVGNKVGCLPSTAAAGALNNAGDGVAGGRPAAAVAMFPSHPLRTSRIRIASPLLRVAVTTSRWRRQRRRPPPAPAASTCCQ